MNGLRTQLRRASDVLRGGPDGLARRAFFNAAGRFTPVLAVDRDGLRFFVSTSDRVLSRRIFVYPRVPERDIQQAFAVLRQIRDPSELEGCTVVEIGANIGSHTVELLCRYGAGEVVAIEPNPQNFALVRQNALANGVGDRVRALQMALSDHDGAAELELAVRDAGDHRVRVRDAATGGAEALRDTIEVAAARFDTLVERGIVELGRTGLLWMDAQGHEAHILSAASSVLGSEIPIVMEYWPYGLRRAGALEALHQLIAEHYRYVIDLGDTTVRAPRVIAADEIPQLASEHGWSASSGEGITATDLILAADISPKLRLRPY